MEISYPGTFSNFIDKTFLKKKKNMKKKKKYKNFAYFSTHSHGCWVTYNNF